MSRRGAAWSVLLAGWQPLAVVLAHAVLAHAAQAELAQPNVKVRVLKRPSRGATRLIMRDVPPRSSSDKLDMYARGGGGGGGGGGSDGGGG